MKFSGVIFDNDGVLVDSEIIAVTVERELLAELGLHYEKDEFTARFTGMSDDAFYAALDADRRERVGKPLPSDMEARIDSVKWPRFETELKSFEGAADLIDGLDRPKAVASSARVDKLAAKLRMTGLYDLFAPHIYSSEQVGIGKPAPDLFLFAARSIGCAPEECVVIEDSLNGVLAGVAAGMTVWGFTGGGHADDRLATRLGEAGAQEVFNNYAEISARL